MPAVTAQIWMQPATISLLLLSFAAFSLVASGSYLINDLVDIETDRAHPAKRNRAFAAGELGMGTGAAAGSLLMLSGLGLGVAAVNPAFGAHLAGYLVLALAYTFVIKRILVLDVIALAGLYAVRLTAGGAAANVEISAWLLAFSMFFFLSIAFAKRLVELESAAPANTGRAYDATDVATIRSVGPASGLLSILVLALYINSAPVRAAYAEPRFLWLLCVLLLYWLLRLWFLAMRGDLHHDPVVFALRDKGSYLVGAGSLLVLYIASQ